MKITSVKVFKTNGDNGTLANCSATIDNALFLTGIKLRNGSNGMYISFPSWKSNKQDENGKDIWKEHYFMNKEAKQELQTMIINEYSGQAPVINNTDDTDDLPF